METDAEADAGGDVDREGLVAPATAAEARAVYRTVGPAARTVVRETARAMGFDREEYGDRVTGEVVETARDALFASLLEVRVGPREAYEAWREGYDGTVHETGSRRVGRVVWHAPPFADEAVAATFAEERAAAVGTLRRQAFGRIYRDRLYDDADADAGADDAAGAGAAGRGGADAGEGPGAPAGEDGAGRRHEGSGDGGTDG